MQIKWPLLASTGILAGVLVTSSPPANAVVYCKTAGVPKGCVVRPVRITAKPDSDYDRCRTALRRKPDSNPKEAGQHLDEAGHCRPSTYG